LWNYFFHVRRPHDLEVELMVSGGHGYLDIPIPRSMKGWRKKWFYLRNDASALLPMFIGGRPIPLPFWGGGGDGVARKDLSKLQPMCEALQ
jgi:hypothetical protein